MTNENDYGFGMLRLGIEILAKIDENPDIFLDRIKELENRYTDLRIQIARLQQEIYEAVQAAWKKQRKSQK